MSNPSNDNEAIDWATQRATQNSHLEVVKWLFSDPRVDSSALLRNRQHPAVVLQREEELDHEEN